jgi:predicted AlkP superfamily phosphohydrolase/phosphomutase
MSPPTRRVLVLGLDGGTFDLLDPLVAAGKLPFLAGRLREGVSAPLASVFPPKTIPAWYSFATGLDPGQLGIYGFTEPDGGPGRSKLVQTFRPAEAIWDHLSRRGRSVGILNFPLRAPYPVNGFFVPGMFGDVPETYPAGLYRQIQRGLGERYLPELPTYREADREAWIHLARRGVEQRATVAERLIAQYRPDFLFVLFRETDRIEHQHWAELDRPVAEIPDELVAFWRSVDRACAAIEAAFRAEGGPALTLIISDHGHGPAGTDFFTNRWLLERGYLRFRRRPGAGRRQLVSRLLMGLDRFGPTRRLLQPVVEKLRGGPRREQLAQLVAGDASFEALAGQIDWRRSVAYSYPVPEGIYLNPYNPELTPERKRALVAELRGELARFPGAQIEALEPAELYDGSVRGNAPALLLRINGLATESRMDFSYPRTLLERRPGYFYGTGIHRLHGILIGWGDGVVAAPRRAEAYSLLDIAPTVLEAMGSPVPSHLAGRSFAATLGAAAGG